MSDEQKAFNSQLSANRERLQEKVEMLLQKFVRQLCDDKPPAIETADDDLCHKSQTSPSAEKVNVSVQTDIEPVQTRPSALEKSQSIATNDASPDFSLQPLPQGEEALRAEVAALSSLLMSSRSKARSLEQAMVSLRQAMSQVCEDREKLTVALRNAEAKEGTQQEVEQRLVADLRRAGNEVECLRHAINNFHKPGSRIYESVKDAVERSKRGEAPLNPPSILRSSKRNDEGTREQNTRPNKRPRVTSADSSPCRAPPNNPQTQIPSQPSPRSGCSQIGLETSSQICTVQPASGTPPPQSQPPKGVYLPPSQSAPGYTYNQPQPRGDHDIRPVPNSHHPPARPSTFLPHSQTQHPPVAPAVIRDSQHQLAYPQDTPNGAQRQSNSHSRSHSGSNAPDHSHNRPSLAYTAHQSHPLVPPPGMVLYFNSETGQLIYGPPLGGSGAAPPIKGLLPHPSGSSNEASTPIVFECPTATPPTSSTQPKLSTSSQPHPSSTTPPNPLQIIQSVFAPIQPPDTSQAPSSLSSGRSQSQTQPQIQAFDSRSLGLQAAANQTWTKSIGRISNPQEAAIASVVFPRLFSASQSGKMICKICGGQSDACEFPEMFYHALLQHKNEYDIAHGLAFPPKAKSK